MDHDVPPLNAQGYYKVVICIAPDTLKKLRRITGRTVINQDVVIERGTYRVPDKADQGVLQISGRDFTVNMEGARLYGKKAGESLEADNYSGIGLKITGENITVKNGLVGQFHRAIVLEKCRNVSLVNFIVEDNYRQRLHSTVTKWTDRDWLDIFWEASWRSYGSSIVLDSCEGCTVMGNKVRRSQNGIVLFHSSYNNITGNDIAFLSGWGIGLWHSSANKITNNRADFCLREENYGWYLRGGDSASIMIQNGSDRNLIASNSFKYGGDGFFISQPPSNDNFVAMNDCRFSPANAIESTFSSGNIFVGNNCSESGYGFWNGYSHGNVLIGNRCNDNRYCGVAIEHGYDNLVDGNECRGNGSYGMLFSTGDKPTSATDYMRHDYLRATSHDTAVVNNLIDGNAKDPKKAMSRSGIFLKKSQRFKIKFNRFRNQKCAVYAEGDISGLEVKYNDMKGAGLILRGTGNRDVRWNAFRRGEEELLTLGMALVPPEISVFDKDIPEGVSAITVGTWGPLDPRTSSKMVLDKNGMLTIQRLDLRVDTLVSETTLTGRVRSMLRGVKQVVLETHPDCSTRVVSKLKDFLDALEIEVDNRPFLVENEHIPYPYLP